MSNNASILEIISNSYVEFYTEKVIDIITHYVAYKSNIVSDYSPLRNFIYELAQNTPKIGDIKDPSCVFLDKYISNSVNSATGVPNIWQNLSGYDKYYFNFFIFRYIEFKFSTNIPFEMLNTFKQLYPCIEQFTFVSGMDIDYNFWFKYEQCKEYFNTMLLHVYEKNVLLIPEGVNKETYLKQLTIQGEIMASEFKVRIGYLNNLNSSESQQYFYDLIVKYRCKFIQTLENISNPEINKSTILTILYENNKLYFQDFTCYNWEDQTKTFLWSVQEKTANTNWFKCKETDFSAVSNIFQDIKNKELADFSQDPTQGINSTQKIGNNKHIRAIPANSLIGILYDDTLNSANIKYISSVSKVK